jgi:hypothetical protein
MDRTVIRAYAFIALLTTIIAGAAIVWFGPDAHLANTPGAFGEAGTTPSVWMLLLAPPLLLVVGACCATMVNWPNFGDLSPDAQRSLSRYRSAVRHFFIGVGILGAAVQGLAVARTAGLVLPAGFDMRAFYFGFGAILAYTGNVIPKIPYASDRWFNASNFADFNRFGGWVISIGGIVLSLTALVVPIERLQSITLILICAAIGLPVLNGLLILARSQFGRRSQ